MNSHKLLWLMVREPSKSRANALFSSPKMLMRRLQRCDKKIGRRDRFRLAHHLPLVCAIAVDGNKQRSRARNILRNKDVVIQVDLSFECKVRPAARFVAHRLVIQTKNPPVDKTHRNEMWFDDRDGKSSSAV
jgi:hypothetical protein